MVSDFLLPWSQLNLLSLSSEKQDELASLGVPLEAVTYFEYGKIEEGYWTEILVMNKNQYIIQDNIDSHRGKKQTIKS